jgi:uncharacterized protein (DUF433 family)
MLRCTHANRRKTDMTVGYQGIVSVEPGKRSGKPCVRGMRITVYDVLSYLAAGMSHEQILADFPELTEEDILACMGYAAVGEQQTLVAR